MAVFDQAISARESHAKVKNDKELSERAKKGEARQLLLEVILPILADPSIPDEQVGLLLSPRIRDLGKITQGTIGKAHAGQQTEQARCLTLLTNAVVTWTTEYYQLAVEQLRAGGREVPDEVLAHISPAHNENVNFFGVINVEVEAELAKLNASGRRPLRPAHPDHPVPAHLGRHARAGRAPQLVEGVPGA